MTESEYEPTEGAPGGSELIRTRHQIEDRMIRWIGIPVFGLVIPNLTGLFGSLTFTDLSYWWGYLYFIGLSASIWMGNRWLLFQQRKHWNWFRQPVQKLLILISANIFYTFPLTVVWLSGWYLFLGIPVVWETILTVTLMNVICVIFVTHAYETVFLIKERESDAVFLANTERSRAIAELEALKNQIDPHFMFNSLNTLSHLIEESPARALQFNEKLADVYRYILMSKGRNLVWLKEEIHFLKNYIFLVQLRFGEALLLQDLQVQEDRNFLIPPISLQLLAENAIKHNEFSRTRPMRLELKTSAMAISLSNPVYPRSAPVSSTGKGLANLRERFKLLTDRDIEVESQAHVFRVKLPLLSA